MVLTLRFRLLRPIPPHPRVLTPRFRHRHLTPPLQRRPMVPQRLHLPRFPPPRLRALPLRFPPLPLTLPRLRFQHPPLLTLTRHRLRVLRLTLHPRLLVPITPRRVMLRPPRLLVLRPQATWRRL